jgi:hypothetical protein
VRIPQATQDADVAGRSVFVAAAFGLAWYLLHGGLGTLNPLEDGWLQSEDLSQHYLGWLHFRRAPWSWPIGRLPELGYPVGTTVGFMDANPWLCLLFRPFSAWLPLRFQFQGLWLASCFTLLAVASQRTASCLTRDRSSQLLIAALVTTAPSALLRVCHENLAAQWFIVSGVYLCLRPSAGTHDPGASAAWARQREARHCVVAVFVLFAWSIGSHAYLTAMATPLWVAALVRRAGVDRSLSRQGLAAALGGMGVGGAALLFAFGFFGTGIAQTEPGFGSQVADLTAFINPVGWSRVLPSFARTADQFEGFCYLGLGSLALIAVAGALCIGGHGRARTDDTAAAAAMWRPLFAIALGCACFAVSDTIWLEGRVILSLRPYSQPLLGLLGIFRASGRFLWVLQYVLLFASAAALARRLPAARARLVLAACLILQLLDLQPVDVREKLVRREASPLVSPTWRSVGQGYRHLALVPAFFPSNQQACGWHYRWGYHVPCSFLAYDANVSFNSNYAGRADGLHIGQACTRARQALAAGQFDDDTVYVVANEAKATFRGRAALQCGTVDGYCLCVTKASGPTRPLVRALGG